MYLNPISKYSLVMILTLNLVILKLSANTISCASTPIFIVQVNQPKAIIVVPKNSTGQLRSAALLLSDYIYAATNARVAVIDEAGYTEEASAKIWIGRSHYVSQQNIAFNNIDGDGFVIDIREDRNIVIAGTTDWGTEFGVYEFLERFLGIRWLLPGPAGEHVPRIESVQLQPQQIVQKPAFFSRLFSGFRGGEIQNTWARRNRMHGQIAFHHNLVNLFPAEKYKNTHPEFFPLRNGQRKTPSDNKDENWQPCFSAAGIVEEAIKTICDYFEKNPDQTSYSLGINDSGDFCTCDACMAKVGSKKNILGFSDYSCLYYDWANQVVEGVLKKYPGKRFGCLAYREVAEPPVTFSVHPGIIPFMTYDRMKWIDPVIESQGKALTERWEKQSTRIGWYDYIYGTPYLVPRVYFHKMAEYYRFAHQHGVQAMYAEAYPNWGEGPKLYVSLKLLWDPEKDVDVLLKEWYEAAVGINAADDLAQYYRLWEDFWANRVKNSAWFRQGGQWLCFDQPGYLDLVTYEDIEKSRNLLEGVAKKTETPEQRERANLIMRTFEYYEASVVSYLGLVKNRRQPGKDKKYYEAMRQKSLDLENAFERDPVLIHPIHFEQFETARYE